LNRSRFTLGAATFALLLCGGMASAQTAARMTIISGNGQLICSSTALCLGSTGGFNFESMVVKVTDANGNPVPNATVNWTITAGDFSGSLRNQTTTTDSNGITSNNYDLLSFIGVTGTSSFAFSPTTIVASTGNVSATFTETQALPPNPNGGQSIPPITLRAADTGVYPYPGTQFSGAVGSSGTPIKVQLVTTALGTPVPNVAVLLVNDKPAGQAATIQCAEQAGAGQNTVLTDASGIATCTPIFGGNPSQDNTAWVSVGGAYPLEHLTDPTKLPTPYFQLPGGDARVLVHATPGAPAALRLVSGNSQTAQAGQPLANPLVVSVESGAGAGLAGSTVNWVVSPAAAATLGSSTSTSDANGRASNTLRFSSTASGNVSVTATLASDASKTATFTVTALPNVTVTGLQIISGNNQSAIVNSAFASPLVVQLGASGGAASGFPVQFTVTGPATLSATSATTNASGQAQVNVQAGAQAGAVTVTASSGGFTQSFSLTVAPPGPTLTAGAFMNAADFQGGALSPCSLATVIAPGLAPGLQGMVVANYVGPLPFLLANDKVTVGGSAAPILSVGLNGNGREQLTFQVPCDVNPGSSVPVVINVGPGSNSVNIPIQAASPGIFQTAMSDGRVRAVMLRPDGSFVSLQNPARRGENLVAFATGMGVTNPLVGTNAVAAPGAIVAPQGTVVVGMAGGGVPLISAQLSYDMVGLWLVTFSVPASVPTGTDVTFSISLIPSGASAPISSATTTIPVQ
jgi:uncharacterized protein (TIGR03437 family)